MSRSYSVYEAKTHLSELLRKVRAGQRVTITVRGEEVAEIRPIPKEPEAFEERIRSLEERGRLSPATEPAIRFEPLARGKGALSRFLADRE